ncbi:MAG: hypothetical protein DRQ52_10535 [Gammaproteobacteria bacterium]|nr:MAG: hypothetical protein DRQ52_10535 [Gammaproteobacteria bacterium]
MNCIEFRRHCLHEGVVLDQPAAAHVDECAECQRFFQNQTQFESLLSSALAVPVPEELASKVKLRKSFAPRWNIRHCAMAAMLLLSIGTGLRLFYGPAPLDEALLAHALEAHAYRGAADQPMPIAKVSRVTAGLGAHLNNLGDIRYAGHCRIHGRMAVHLLVNTDMGRYTLFLMPDEQIKERFSHEIDGHQVVMFPSGNGSIGVVVPAGSDWVENAEEQVREAVSWSV